MSDDGDDEIIIVVEEIGVIYRESEGYEAQWEQNERGA